MNSNNIVYLASKSLSRRYLLEESKIPYQIIEQNAPETSFNPKDSLDKIVKQIALEKMEYAILPNAVEDKKIYVLTADTLCQDNMGNIFGKPLNYEDAIYKIKSLRDKELTVYTSYCLDLKISKDNIWQTTDRISKTIDASCIIDIPDEYIEIYLNSTNAINASGALVIENYGMQFVKSVNGSYSSILGLPLFELRQSLHELDFFV